MAMVAFGKQSMRSGLRMIDGVAVKKSELDAAIFLSKVM
jgi:hypothetical protein